MGIEICSGSATLAIGVGDGSGFGVMGALGVGDGSGLEFTGD